MIKLHHAPGSCSLAPLIALEEAGADFEIEWVDLTQGGQRAPQYLAINPKGRVPALVTERGVLTECPAILAYVAQRWPEARLAPVDDPWAFAQMQAFNVFLTSSVHVAWAHISRPGRYADGEAAAAAMAAKSREALPAFFALIEDGLKDGRPWVIGDAYSVADPYLMMFTGWVARRGLVDMAAVPGVAAHHDRAMQRPAVERALAWKAPGA